MNGSSERGGHVRSPNRAITCSGNNFPRTAAIEVQAVWAAAQTSLINEQLLGRVESNSSVRLDSVSDNSRRLGHVIFKK